MYSMAASSDKKILSFMMIGEDGAANCTPDFPLIFVFHPYKHPIYSPGRLFPEVYWSDKSGS